MSVLHYSDHDTQSAVEAELRWSSDVTDDAAIGVGVEDGVVVLSGEVNNHAEKVAAKKATRRVRGVTTVVDELTIHPATTSTLTDTDIGKEVERALKAASNIPDGVTAEVANHAVTLRGVVDWDTQRQAAARAVQYLRGVHAVNNLITLSPRVAAVKDAENRIKDALVRNALVEAGAITVRVDGHEATLTGTVRSWDERHQVEHAVWASPHIVTVINHLAMQS
ncbi:transporter [Tsukamurella tyrosinosolvens]|nr:transporter [Tsukamurella tyrosinosolvens]